MMKLMIGLLIIACIAPLFIKGPDGEPIMRIDDWAIDLPEPVEAFFSDLMSGRTPSASTIPSTRDAASAKVYRWQDEKGQWHFSNTPPNSDVAEEITIADVNLMDAYVPPGPEPVAVETSQAPGSLPGGVPGADQMQEMMETVNSYQATMEQRNQALEDITGGGH
ncbi:MAG: DUF4124 domain-containing protein [Pseudomonadales bacterium]|nr:DUF4124 domain-containing protein [Pseudomonadales bacterium]